MKCLLPAVLQKPKYRGAQLRDPRTVTSYIGGFILPGGGEAEEEGVGGGFRGQVRGGEDLGSQPSKAVALSLPRHTVHYKAVYFLSGIRGGGGGVEQGS